MNWYSELPLQANDEQEKFAEHSKKILGKCNFVACRLLMIVNDMSTRIDELEKSLEKVLQQEEASEASKQ